MSRNNDTYRLWQHASGTYYVIWSDRSETKSGKTTRGTKRVSAGTTDRASAEQFRAQFIAGLNNPAPPPEPTISYLLKRYEQEHGVLTRSHSTIQFHMKTLLPYFGDLLPCHITNNSLRQFADSMRKEGKSDGYIRRQLGTLKAALHYAEGNRWIAPLPQFVMPVNSPPPKDLWLTREQVGALIDKAKSPHIRLFILLAVSTAARTGAILELTWPQVDMSRQIIDFGTGWSNKRRSVVPYNSDVKTALEAAKEIAETDHVIEFQGKAVKCVRQAFVRLCKECCIKASPHTLRHTAATWLVMDGVPLREVARLLGNSEAMVEKVYGKHSPDYLRRAVNVLKIKPTVLQV